MPDPERDPRRRRGTLFLLVCLGLTLWGWHALRSRAPADGCRVVRVIDGDTIVVDRRGVEEKVRYIGVNAPERDTFHAEEYKAATAFNRQLLSEGWVILELDAKERDVWGRLLAYVYIDQGGRRLSVNEELLRFGYAKIYVDKENTRYARRYQEIYEEARREKRGLWK